MDQLDLQKYFVPSRYMYYFLMKRNILIKIYSLWDQTYYLQLK